MNAVRTYRREDIDASRRAWEQGDFSWEWHEWRKLAANAGIIYPPEGTKWDSWDDDDPSQRALLIRAIRETPELLRTCLARCHSWGSVVAMLLNGRDRMRVDATYQDKDAEWARQHEPDDREATKTLKQIIDRIGAS